MDTRDFVQDDSGGNHGSSRLRERMKTVGVPLLTAKFLLNGVDVDMKFCRSWYGKIQQDLIN